MNKADLLKKLESIKAGIDKAPANAKPLMQKAIDNIESQIAELDKEGNVKPEAKAETKTEGRAKAGRPKGTTKPKAEKEKRGRGRPAKKVVEKAPEEKPVTEVQINKVAKDIREEGEPMIRARKRAKKALTEIKEVAKETKQMESKGTLTKSKILAEIKKLNKVFANLGVDIVVESAEDLFRDATRTALPKGRRISKNGNEYYESRANRSDSLQGTAIYPKLKLAEGGEIEVNKKIDEIEDYLEKTYNIDIYVKVNKAIKKGRRIEFWSEDPFNKIFGRNNYRIEPDLFSFYRKIEADIKEKFGLDSDVKRYAIAVIIPDSKKYPKVDELEEIEVGDMVYIYPNYESIYSFKYAEVVKIMPDNKTCEVKIHNKNGNEYVKFEKDELLKLGNKLSEAVKKGMKREYAKGGMVDLFDDYENMPLSVAKIVERYQDEFGEDMNYQDTQDMLKEVEAVGYTFEFGLDNEPYGLRPIGTPLNALMFYEDVEDEEEDDDYEDYDDENGDGSEREYLVVCQDRESGEQQEFEVYAEDEEEAREMALSDCDFKNPKIISVERYAKGGSIDDYSKNLASVEVKFANPKYNYETNVSADTNEAEVRRYFVGQMFDVGVYPKENMQRVVDIVFHPKGTYAKGGLIASSPSLDGIKKMISDYYFGSTISLVEVGNNTFEVHNAKGVRPSVEVVKKAGRYRFQQKGTYAKGGSIRKFPFLDYEIGLKAKKSVNRGHLPYPFVFLEPEKTLIYFPNPMYSQKWIKLGTFLTKKDAIDWIKSNLQKEGFAKGGRTYAMPEEKIIS